jgi:hypothetical protein
MTALRFFVRVATPRRRAEKPVIQPVPILGDTPMRRHILAIVPAVLALAACSDSSTPTSPTAAPVTPSLAKGAPASGQDTPPVIDGVMSAGEWDGAATMAFMVNIPTTEGAQAAKLYVTHDKTYLYTALQFNRKSTFHANDWIAVQFDNDNDGIRENGDDVMSTSTGPGAWYWQRDAFVFANGAATGSDSVAAAGGVSNIKAAFGAVGTVSTFEMRHELDTTDDAHDFSIDPTQGPVTVGVNVMVSLEANPIGSKTMVFTDYPASFKFCKLTIDKKTTSISCP